MSTMLSPSLERMPAGSSKEKRTMSTYLMGLLAVSLSATTALAAQVPAPNPAQGDGGVSSFYTWWGDTPAAPGQMRRSDPLEPNLGLAMAGEQRRILYSSIDGIDGQTPITVSGAYFLPKGTPPSGGWPLLAWAHGTTGVGGTRAPLGDP